MRFPARALCAAGLAALAACHGSDKHDPAPETGINGKILQAGLCEPGPTVEKYAQPAATAGYATRGNLIITTPTTDVPLKKGAGFGYLWHASGLPPTFDVVYRIQHPPITRPDGQRAAMFEETVSHASVEGQFETADCYFLDEPYEMVPGDWTITLLVQDKVIATRTFNVLPAPR